jgi:biofilm PGA synthesis N-glycosyltransferase PgaC
MMLEQYMVICLWSSVALLVYVFVGYPVVMIVRARFVKEWPKIESGEWPTVSAVVVMGNEADRAQAKIADILANGYPSDKLEIIVVLDAPDDDTQEILDSLNLEDMSVVFVSEKRGKSACLNDGVNAATGEILFFCDTRQFFKPGAINCLVRHFSDPAIGAVSGELIIEGGEMGAYWKFEKALRRAESRTGSVIGCTGAIYAIRKELYVPISNDTILDDVVIPMQCVAKGHFVKFEPDAVAIDPQPAAMAFETRRKIRTLAGNWQMLFRHPTWLLPWKNRSVIRLVSHKYLRLAGPWLMALAYISNFALTGLEYRLLLGAQSLIYLVAGIGLAYPRMRHKPVRLAATFIYLNWLNAASFPAWALGLFRHGWRKTV